MKKFSTISTLILAFVFVSYISVYAQEIKPEKISKPIGFGTLESLKDVTPIPVGSLDEDWSKREIPNEKYIDDELHHMPPMTEPDPILQDWTGGTRAASPPPVIQQNFEGLDNEATTGGSGAPPDTQGDVGLNHYVQVVNSAFAIWDKEGTMLYGPADIITIWDGFTGPWSSTNDGDPIVVYDEYADRWIISQFSLPNGTNSGPWYELIAVSQTGDPTEGWYQYAYQYDRFPDYPKFGVWQNGYYMTTHMFNPGPSFYGGFVSAFDKEAMLEGDPDAQTIDFNLGSANYGLQCLDADGILPPPDGEPQYVVDVRTNSLKIYKIEVDWDDLNNSTASTLSTLPVPNFSTSIVISQPGTNEKLDSQSDKTMYRAQYRNFGDYEVMMVNHTISVGGARSGIRWYELRKEDEGTWYIYQQGTFGPDDSEGRWMGSIAMNQNGDIGLGYSVSSSSTYPSIRFTGQSAGAPEGLGIMDIEETEILTGAASQNGINRWGDYSMISVDPSNHQTFWYTQQFSNGGWNWDTQIASFDFVQVPQTDFTSDETIIPTGETVNFTDLTTGLPDSWDWSFQGGTPSISSMQNPEGIKYNTEGTYTVILETSNVLGTDTETKEAYITVSSTILPEVDFESDKNFVCVGEEVSFTDLTLYSPIQWNWQFEPATVTFVEGTDNTSQNPVVMFDEATDYTVTLESWNLNGSSTKTETDYVLSGGYETYYLETFEEGTLRSNNWTIENPDADISWELFSIGGTTPGSIAAGIDFSNYTSITERDRLISPAFNLEGLSIASLEFQYAYAQRHLNLTDSLIVLVSSDCGENWTRVYANGEDGDGSFATHEFTDDFWPTEPSDWCMSGWGARCVTINLTPWAGMSNVQIAFETFNSYGNPLFIDNVAVSQTVDVEEVYAESEVSVYPNPASGTFQVVMDEEFTTLKLYNNIGQLVHEQEIERGTNVINIDPKSDWNTGIYSLEVSGFNKTITKKVVLF